MNKVGFFNNYNCNKLGIILNMGDFCGRDLVYCFIGVSDAFIENFVLGVMECWGLDEMSVWVINFDIVYVCMSGYGHLGL